MEKQDQFETRIDKFARNISEIRTWTGLKTKKILSWPDVIKFPKIEPGQLRKVNDRRWH